MRLHGATVLMVTFATTYAGVTADGRPAKDKARECHDITVPENTLFRFDVPFETGESTLRGADRITIKEVRGTTDSFAVDGEYIVRGEYQLDSYSEGTLMLTISGGCTRGGNGRDRLEIQRGAGTFELVTKIPYKGFPHVWIAIEDARDGAGKHGGVYFGKGDFLKR